MGLFTRRPSQLTSRVDVHLNARVQPIHRGEIYEDPLDRALKKALRGSEVIGGGSTFDPEHGVLSCDIELQILGDLDVAQKFIIDTLEECGAPRGSWLESGDGDKVTFGKLFGFSLALDGTTLPQSIYADNDVNILIGALVTELEGVARLQSWWEGPSWTSLFFYGDDEVRIRTVLERAAILSPLAQGSRVEAIA